MKQTPGIISSPPFEPAAEEGDELLAAPEIRRLEVPPQQHGARLDKALAECVPEFSRSYLQQLVEEGCLSLNGSLSHKVSQKVKVGDRLVLELKPTPQSQAFKPEAMALEVAYEDEHILVINKPAGLVVHPAPGNWSGTLLNGLLARHPDFSSVPRAGIVHRLDKDTSGLMVVARHREAMDALVQAIAARTVSRQYLALAHGAWSGPERRTVDAALGRDPRNRLRMAIVDLDLHAGKPARTDVVLLGQSSDSCFVQCILHTGRTHQIRVHMASLGHPLLADSVYGGRPAHGMERQALHAFRLAFDHPVTGQKIALEARPPSDFMIALQVLGLRYNPPQALQT